MENIPEYKKKMSESLGAHYTSEYTVYIIPK